MFYVRHRLLPTNMSVTSLQAKLADRTFSRNSVRESLIILAEQKQSNLFLHLENIHKTSKINDDQVAIRPCRRCFYCNRVVHQHTEKIC